jgi:hypothetical protein
MSRVDVSEVTDTFDTDEDPAAINQWISIASEYVDDIADADSGVSSSRLKKIELLVSQHLLAIQDPLVEQDQIGDSTIVYQGEYGMDWDASQYGQHAQMLDPTNTLVDSKKPTPTVDVLNSRDIDRPR